MRNQLPSRLYFFCRLRSFVCVIFLIVGPLLAIDMSKFKKCEDSSFCKFVLTLISTLL